jgi:hypothetical protein
MDNPKKTLCWFCEQEAQIKVFNTWVCAACAERLFDPTVGSGSVASKIGDCGRVHQVIEDEK